MDNIIEAQKGIFEFTTPQEISTELWANETAMQSLMIVEAP